MKRRVKSNKPSNKLISLMIVLVVIVLCVVFGIKSKEIKAQNLKTNQMISELQSEIESEQARTDELKEFEKYTNTKKFVEEIARAKFGLIYPDEYIFKAEE